MKYLFKSERLGYRPWQNEDIAFLYKLCANKEVMRHFPSTLNLMQTGEFLDRLQKHQQNHGYCYFMAELLETNQSIGFIGLAYQNYESDYTPCTDIGWRLMPEFWGAGLATEGARRMIELARDKFGLPEVKAFATAGNIASIKVMERCEMDYLGSFDHPKLVDYPDLARCVAYGVKT